ncbi:MAG TPA: transposase [Acidobacteriota bacterium]|nr:transposase [Acidobacteriota bacterium]HQF88371.1 transposase [Acidobacteriota bacterium]HQG92894.1 transposase [Acidobacteriota bacterium]HQK86986.1 transposase [Acidobacteriota bacterium]
MTIARRDIAPEGVAGAYHCTARCVRQAWLCGQDAASGRNYDHRKEWILERLAFLAMIFALDVMGYAIMNNHLHTLLRTLPDLVRSWADWEVARRWLILFPSKRMRRAEESQPSNDDIAAMLRPRGRVEVLRQRLCSLSWFMRCLDEHIARRANREDGCKGRFWEGRFKCRALADEAAVLTAMVYVDLNPIRAGLATTPEASAYTSAQQRIAGQQTPPSVWNKTFAVEGSMTDWLCPLTDSTERQGVFRRLTLYEYLILLDTAGRVARPDKPGVIPRELAPIMERLGLEPANWMEAVRGYERYFRRFVGRPDTVATLAETAGRRWFHGIAACRTLLNSPRSCGACPEASTIV